MRFLRGGTLTAIERSRQRELISLLGRRGLYYLEIRELLDIREREGRRS